jgi:hypothetical protein
LHEIHSDTASFWLLSKPRRINAASHLFVSRIGASRKQQRFSPASLSIQCRFWPETLVVIGLNDAEERCVIAELKGADWKDTADVKAQAARRWCAAVNATGDFGSWDYKLAFGVPELVEYLNGVPSP